MPVRRFTSLLQAVAAVVLVAACAVFLQTRRHAPAASLPSAKPPAVFARLIRAGGTLYWTINQGDEHSVYAMNPSGRPRLLYREHGDIAFGAPAFWRQLTVVVDEFATGSSRINLLPLRPGYPPRKLAVPRRIGPGDLLTEGSHLLWADDRGLRAMPASGGPVRMLVREGNVGDLALARGRLYYVSGRTVKSVAVTGGAPTTEIRAANNITTLCVSDQIYWSELGVTVQSPGRTHWTGVGGHYTTDISCAGPRLVWSDCPASHTGCEVLVRYGGRTHGFAAGPEPRDLHDDGITTAYLNANGPNAHGVDPAWTHQPAPPAPSRPECRPRACYRGPSHQ